MKIIDEKGRLFGRMNVIDFLAVLFLFCLLPAFYFGYKILTKDTAAVTVKKVFIEIETDCRFIKLRPEELRLISVGDKALDDNGRVTGEIIDIGKSEPYKYKIDIGKGKKIIKEDARLKQIEVKLKLKVLVKDDMVYYRGKLIKVGLPFRFITDKYSLSSMPVEEAKEETKTDMGESVTAVLKIKCSNLLPELAKVVKAGDTQIEIVNPGIKRILARANKVVSNEPTEIITLYESRKWTIIGHPKNRDLILEIKAICLRRPEGLFLKDNPVRIGRAFEFSTELYSISGMVIDIEVQ
jgi:hypothetical protein